MNHYFLNNRSSTTQKEEFPSERNLHWEGLGFVQLAMFADTG